MNPLFLMIPMLALQAPPVVFPEVEAKDLAQAPRGPMVPPVRDAGAEPGVLGQARRSARRGPSIPALQLPVGSVRVQDKVPDLSGWRA